jgi:hypothetical protein
MAKYVIERILQGAGQLSQAELGPIPITSRRKEADAAGCVRSRGRHVRRPRLRLLQSIAGPALLIAVHAGGLYAQQYPILPSISTPPIASLAASVQGIDLETFYDSNFGSVTAAGTVTELDVDLNPYATGGQASILAIGGFSPMLESSGVALGNGVISANGTVTYFFQLLPLNSQIQAPGPIPLQLHGSGGGSITIGSQYLEGTIVAEVRVKGTSIGFYGLSVFEGHATSLTDTFIGSYPLAVNAYDLNPVELELASGIRGHVFSTGSSSFEAFVDPILVVDRDATFEHQGQPLRYVDHYGIAYSPGVEQWQPDPVFASGFESGDTSAWSSTTP